MSLGTLAINNNSDQVAGTDTSFTVDLKVNDFIAVPSGGVTYTMVVKAIASDTALTITRPFSGPNVTGANWAAIPAGTMVGVTAKIADDTSYTMRMYVNEATNWMNLLTVDGDVTVYAPDGSSYTGPSWLKLSRIMSSLDMPTLTTIAAQVHTDALQVAADTQTTTANTATATQAAQTATTAAQSVSQDAQIATTKAGEASASAVTAKNEADRAATANPDNQLKKANNLSDVADRAVSWLNIRPIGATPLAADPIGVLDAATRGWCLGKMENPIFANNATSMHKETTLPAGATAGGYVASSLYEGNNEIAVSTYSIAYTKATPTAVTRLITALRTASGYPAKASTFAHDSDGNISFDGEGRGKVFSGRDGAFGPAVIKKADRSSADADNVNYLSQVANNTAIIYNYLVTPSGVDQQYVTRMDVIGQQIKYFSIRVDNGSYTPEGRLAVQGSDVRIKDGFKPVKEGSWERIEQIGIMEFYYRGNPAPQRGWLAQQMGDIDDLYVFNGGTAVDINGKEFEILNVNDRAVMADVITVVQELQRKNTEIETLKSEVADLKELVNLMLQK